jgi:hypothetical protein
MPYYTKKPIPIEARQVTVENAEELAEWSPSVIVKSPDGTMTGMMVYTLEGTMTGSIGDYLIKGIRGEFYFCAKDIFEESYDLDIPCDPYKVEVDDFIDNDDGSAIVSFNLGPEAMKTFVEIGLLKVLKDSANRVLEDEIDTNVGC